MRVKVGSKLKTQDGQIWEVVRLDHPTPGRVLLQSANRKSPVRFDIDRAHLKKKTKKLGLLHRLFGKKS